MTRQHAMPSPSGRRRVPVPVLLLASALGLPQAAHADAVTDWNAFAAGIVATGNAPPQQFRLMAMVQISVHDALNAIDPRYRTHHPVPSANPDASPEAAIARASRDVLLATVPARSGDVTAFYTAYVAGLPACAAASPQCIEHGEAAGAAAAAAMLQARHLDGSETPHLPYTLAPAPGVHQATSGAVLFGNWGNVTPFAIGNASQFGAGATEFMKLNSKAYTTDYNEVKQVGSAAVRAALPNSEESRIARFWSSGGGDYNLLARAVLAAGAPQGLWDNARTFALMNMAVTDGLFVTFRTKYRYNFWRPQTAIRWADDGNPATAPDPTWTAYITTPPYPDYTCGLPSTIGGSTSVLRALTGSDEVAFTLTAAGITRTFTSLSMAADESADARVFGGIHFRTGCLAALVLSEKVADYVVATQLKPIR